MPSGRRGHANHERHIGRMLNALTYFVEEEEASDEELTRLFTAQLEFTHKLVGIHANIRLASRPAVPTDGADR